MVSVRLVRLTRRRHPVVALASAVPPSIMAFPGEVEIAMEEAQMQEGEMAQAQGGGEPGAAEGPAHGGEDDDGAAPDGVPALAPAADRIAELKAQRKALAQEKKDVQRQLKLEQRRHRRIMSKAKTLTDQELAQVLAERAAAHAKAKAKAKGAGKAKAKAKAKAMAIA